MRVAILGTAPDSKGLAPFHDESWEIWPCSPGNAYGAMPRVTKWFELHGVTDLKGVENASWNKIYFDWLNAQTFPVYMQEPNDLCPQAQVFPIKAWLDFFGNRGRANATSSIALMIGFAIMHMKAGDEIGIWGVDMADVSEAYTLQKSGCINMMLIAKERGIKVTIPLESCLGTMPPLYGYAEASRMGRRLLVRKLTLEAAHADTQNKLNAEERQLYMIKGALDQVQYFMRTFVDGANDAELDVETTTIQTGGQTITAMHSKGTRVEFGDMRPVEVPPTVIPDLEPTRTDMFDVSEGGVLIPRTAGRTVHHHNSGEHSAET